MLPNKISIYRKRAKLTQEGLAQAIGTSRSQLVKLERGERPLTSDWLEKIGEACQVSPHLLIAPDGAVPSVDELAQLLQAAQDALPVGVPYSEWPRSVASELHMRLRRLAGDRATDANQD